MVKTSIVNGLNRDDVVAYLWQAVETRISSSKGKWKRGRRVKTQQASSDLSRRSSVVIQITPNRDLHQSGKPCTEAEVHQFSNRKARLSSAADGGGTSSTKPWLFCLGCWRHISLLEGLLTLLR